MIPSAHALPLPRLAITTIIVKSERLMELQNERCSCAQVPAFKVSPLRRGQVSRHARPDGLNRYVCFEHLRFGV